MKKLTRGAIIAVIISALLLSGCNSTTAGTSTDTTVTAEEQASGDSGESSVTLSDISAQTDSVTFDNKGTVTLGNEIDIAASGVNVSGKVISFTQGGEFTVTGTLSDGMLLVDTDENVKLILSGASVTNSDGCALYVKNAKNLYVELADGTSNSLSDGAAYDYSGVLAVAEGDNAPDAAIYSCDDLIFSGAGTLTVTGSYENGISTNDDLEIDSGAIAVNAVKNGVRGKDSVTVSGGSLSVTCGKDAVKATNDTDEGKGGITVTGGSITINAGEDGIQAETTLDISGGTFNITTTGEIATSNSDMFRMSNTVTDTADSADSTDSTDSEDTSSKGIKAATMSISGGTFTLNTTDTAIHSSGVANLKGGDFTITSSAAKGISVHGDLTIDGGSYVITRSTEGIESKALMTINGGTFDITASDDGLNAGGGTDPFAGGGNFGNKGDFTGFDGSFDGGNFGGGGGKFNFTVNGDGTITDSDGNTITIPDGFGGGQGGQQPTQPTMPSMTDSDGNTVTMPAQGEMPSMTDSDGNTVTMPADMTPPDGQVRQPAQDAQGAQVEQPAQTADGSAVADITATGTTDDVDHSIIINGGTIVVNANGDGIDANNNITVNGGEVYVCGPSTADVALDASEGDIYLNGGTVLAASGSGMADLPCDESKQCSVSIGLDSAAAAGSVVSITDDSGTEILSYTIKQQANFLIVTSAGLESGKSYKLLVNGAEVTSFTMTSTVVTVGNVTGSFGGGNFGGGTRPNKGNAVTATAAVDNGTAL